jgi:hypothetical protein
LCVPHDLVHGPLFSREGAADREGAWVFRCLI